MLAPAAIAATDDDRTLLIQLRAQRLAAAGKCAEMIELADTAPEPARSSAELQLLKGNCLIEQARYDEAVGVLDAARASDPGLRDVDLLIGIAQYHLEDLDAAQASLEAARGNVSREVSQTVSIVDTTAPDISGQGADKQVECTDPVEFDPPTASDLCDPDPADANVGC